MRKIGHAIDSKAQISPDTDIAADDSLIRTILRQLLQSKTTPAAAKAQAARTLAEMRGLLGRHQERPADLDTRPLSGLSQAELRAELARLQGLSD